MKITRSIVLAIALVVGSSTALAKAPPSVAAEKVGMSSERLNRITQMSQRYVDQGKFAGVITMVARKGKLVHFEAVGTKGADDKRTLKKDDLFRIYSMTKPITAAAAMQLYEQGKFQLSDPVHKYVPELKDLNVLLNGELVPVKTPMTMHQLLTHTAGFSYGFNPAGDPIDKLYQQAKLWSAKDLGEFATLVGKLPLKFEPGSQWHYSIAVDVTGLIVQRLSGMPFDEYLQKNIFEPLTMKDTFFEVPKNKAERFLPNHYWNPQTKALGTIPNKPDDAAMANYHNVSLYSGGGGLVSTAMDYMKFAEAMRSGGVLNGQRILSEKTVNYMAKNHLPSDMAATGVGESPGQSAEQRGFGFGLGFGVVTDAVKAAVMGSNGEFNWGGAAGTVFWIDPVEEIVVVGMVQLMGSPWTFRQDLKIASYQAITESYE
ncbi:MAG: CubicO group peptidase (beta-lactamase class C family) [Paraglaciecola psychrophila]|jgi:CubicO group peptidase (beta-lactamase class C family)